MVEKIGPYRVYERLGVGGMGEVFKAYDDRLDRWVAIKRIRPDREDAEDNRERFKREARATARLNHPAIVHLYGIFQEGDSDCIVMEYVEGRTLDSILAEGPLDPLRVASLGHEIASGLAEAHANGILHRDLKAENIIITPRGRSKILDFGLAKPILRSELDPVLTGKGQLVGTSRAMSPEYVSGDNVDHRSDLFALGVLLYETLTGQSPFKAHNTLATLKQVMLHRQTPVKQLSPKVPQELSDLIDRLLEKDPTDRPQSAHEVALAFGRLTGQISSGAVDQPSSGTQPIYKPTTTSTGAAFSASDTVLDLRPRSRWMTVVVVLVALLITAFFLGRYLSGPDKPKITQAAGAPLRVLVGKFNNATGEERFDVTVATFFSASLEQSESLTLLSDRQVQEALRRMERSPDSKIDATLGSELALREGAQALILGSIARIGPKYAISAQVIRPEDQVVVINSNATADDDEGIIAAIQTVSNDIRNGLGESRAEIERDSQPLEKVTTANFEALRAYSIGTKKFQENQNDSAITFLEHALELDPGFAMAHAKLVAIYSSAGNEEKALFHIDAAQAHRDRLPEVEKFYITGWTHRWKGTPKDVIENWSQMSSLHPRELAGHRNLGLALWLYQNDFANAASALKDAFTVADPSSRPEVAELVGYSLLGAGHVAESKSYFEIAASADKAPLIDYFLAAGQRQEADRTLAESSPLPSQAAGLRAFVAAERGDLPKAEAELRSLLGDGLSGNAQPPGKSPDFGSYADLITVLFLQEKKGEVVYLADQFFKTAPAYSIPKGLATNVSSLTAMTLSGKLLARLGETSRAQQYAQVTDRAVKKIPIPLWLAHQAMLEAEILLAQGNNGGALARLDSALATADLITVRESRAVTLTRLGRRDEAIKEWQILADSRARSFGEGRMSSVGRLFAVASATLADRAIATLAAESGDQELATERRAQFAALWPAYRF